ncbi:MAG: peptidylprolyl isomerase [Gemmatimonadales bacterium]
MIALVLCAVGCRGGGGGGGGAGAGGAGREAATASAAADFHDPRSAAMSERAPATFRARFETSQGDFVLEVHRDWAPVGADRFYHLVRSGYFDGVRFFRVLSGFMAQFGIHGDPQVSAVWRDQRIPDDPVRQSNTRGMVSYATAGPGTRTTQLFINYGDNRGLDRMGFAPFGRVIEGMEVVDRLHAGYGEGVPGGRGPNQARLQAEGNAYLAREFPKLDQVRRATIVAVP